MAELKMPRKGNAAALLQELNAEHAPITSNEEMKEEMKETSSPRTNEYISNAARRHVSKHGGRASPVASNDGVRASPRKDAKAEGNTGSYMSVKERVFQPGSKEAITRLNLDMPEDLHDALKLYCAQHKIKIRTLVCALVEDYLKQEADA